MVKPNSLAFVQSPMLCLLTNCAKYTTNDHPMAPLSLAQGIFTGDRLAGKNPKVSNGCQPATSACVTHWSSCLEWPKVFVQMLWIEKHQQRHHQQTESDDIGEVAVVVLCLLASALFRHVLNMSSRVKPIKHNQYREESFANGIPSWDAPFMNYIRHSPIRSVQMYVGSAWS